MLPAPGYHREPIPTSELSALQIFTITATFSGGGPINTPSSKRTAAKSWGRDGIPILQMTTRARKDFSTRSLSTGSLKAVLAHPQHRLLQEDLALRPRPPRGALHKPRPLSRESWEAENGVDVSTSPRPPRESLQPQPEPQEPQEQEAEPGRGW